MSSLSTNTPSARRVVDLLAVLSLVLIGASATTSVEQPPARGSLHVGKGGEPMCAYYYGYGCKCVTFFATGCYFWQKQCMEDVNNKDGTKVDPSVTWTCAGSTKESAWRNGEDSVCADATSVGGRPEESNAIAFAKVVGGRPACYTVNASLV